MERKPLKSLVRDALEASGCLVEDEGERLEVLLPQDIATKAGLREHQFLNFARTDGQENEEFVSYDSKVLDSISRLIEGRGLFCKVGLDDLYLKKENLYEAVSRQVSFLNSVYRVERKEERVVSYLLLNFRYSAISEEKTEGLVPIIVNEVTLSSPKEMVRTLTGYWGESRYRGEVKGRRPVEKVYQVSCRIAEQEIRRRLEEFEKRLNRRLNRDIARLHEYYGTLKDEASARIEKRGLLGEDKERELSRIRAIELELGRKSKEQLDRYYIQIEVEVVNALRIAMPALFLILRVRRKDKEKELVLLWNPLVKDVELPVCEACLHTMEGAYLCDERLHLICRQCYECLSCHRRVCHACHPQTCPRCNTPFISR